MSVCICPKPVTAGAGLLFRIIFIFIFTLLLGFDLSFAFLFTFEAFFLLLLNGRLKNGRFRFLLLYPLIFVQAAQLCSVFVTGRYIEPLTLWNLSSASSVGAETQVKLTFIAVLFLAVSLPPHRLRIQKVRTFAWIMAIWGAGELCFDNFPLRAAAVTAGQVYNQLAYNPAYDDGSRFYRKNVVEEGKSSWQNEMTKKKNVILIFAEGMSSEVISEKLTPHTFELRDRSVSFENYYNHTAATFRGIRGQLISGFQLLGGSYGGQGIAEINKKAVDEHFKGRTESLPLILRKNGYQTVFLSPHPESDNFQTFVKGIGFDEVIGSKTAQNWSDRRLYENLFAEAQRLAEQKRPFLLATYVLGTHVGLDSPDVKYDDGKNSFLNKFYNQDYWLGTFLQKFDASAFAKDMILVFTSDHATYPGRDFTELFGEYDYFVGEMPLIFYNKFIMPVHPDAVILFKHNLRFGLFASMDYLASFGYPKDIEDIQKNHRLCVRSNYREVWGEWCNFVDNCSYVAAETNSSSMLMQLTKDGIGIALHPFSVGLKEKNLVYLDKIKFELSHPFWIVSYKDVKDQKKIRVLIDYIKKATAVL